MAISNLRYFSGRCVNRPVSAAQSDIAYRYALKELNPFVITGDNALYAQHNTNGQLDLYDKTTGTGSLTDEWLNDRSKFLAWKNIANPQDNTKLTGRTNDYRNWEFVDITSGYALKLIGTKLGFPSDEPFNKVIFDNDNNNWIDGGGADNDILEGGTGYDRYLIQGRDTVRDADGLGRLEDTSGRILSGAILKRSDGSYSYLNDPSVNVTRDINLTLTWTNGTRLVIENFQSGQLGLTLLTEATPNAAPSGLLNGDQAPQLDAQGKLQYDSWGNIIPLGPQPGRDDVLFDLPGNTQINAGGGNDIVWRRYSGEDQIDLGAGDDTLASFYASPSNSTISDIGGQLNAQGGAGRDYLGGGLDTDTLQGGAGADHLYGNSGNDVLYGDSLNGGGHTDYFGGGIGHDRLNRKDNYSNSRTTITIQ